MPKRPRSHQLETTSRIEFGSLCAEQNWVMRDADTGGDYGIDLEVEIFDGDSTTGLTFRAQIKGSDQDLSKPRTKSISIETLEYWQSFDVPVVFIYYTSKDNRFYGKWAHAHDPVGGFKPGQKTTQFTFDDESLLPDDLSTLERDVRRVRDFKRRATPLPLKVSVRPIVTSSPQSPTEAHQSRGQAGRLSLRSLNKVTAGMLILSKDDESPNVEVEYGEDQLKVRLAPDISTITLSGYQRPPEALVEDVVMCTAITLSNVGWEPEASRLIRTMEISQIRCLSMEIQAHVISILFRTDRHSELIDFATTLMESSEQEELWLSGFILGQHLNDFDRLSPKDRKRIPKQMEKLARKQKKIGLSSDAAVQFYNAGHWHKALGDPPKAITMYELAKGADPEYGRRSYFHEELAGMQYNLARFRESAVSYEAALSFGAAAEEVEPLLVEARLHAGMYGEALRLSRNLTNRSGENYALAVICEQTANAVQKATGLTEQRRRPLNSKEVNIANANPSRESILKLMKSADALDGWLWNYLLDDLAQEHSQEGAQVDTLTDLDIALSAAHFNRIAILWILAAQAALDIQATDLVVNSIIEMGLTLWPDEFLPALAALKSADTNSAFSELFAQSERIAETVHERHRETIFRVNGVDVENDIR